MNFIFYYARPLVLSPEGMPFVESFKIPIYQRFFSTLQANGFTVYLASHEEHYSEDGFFQHPYIFNGDRFVESTLSVKAHVLFDRSFAGHLPPDELKTKTFNTLVFKQLCGNKNTTYSFLKDFMPLSQSCKTVAALQSELEISDPSTIFVIKPAHGIKGSGIFIDTPPHLLKHLPTTGYPYILQEFVDTRQGIPDITDSVHDLRFISTNGKIVLSALRTPAPGSLLANVAKGGSIREIPFSQISEGLLALVNIIHSQIESRYPGSCYSMDFGYDKGRAKWFLFELNDRIGFPRPDMPHANDFADQLAARVIDFAKEIS
jgi:hypothetical protein